MATKKKADEAAATAEATREGEADAVAEQTEQMQKATDKAAAEVEKVEGLKSTPEGSAAPTERTVSGEQKYARERLIEEAYDFVGHPPHVVAGALATVPDAYLSRDETTKAVEEFLEAPSYTTPITPETPAEA